MSAIYDTCELCNGTGHCDDSVLDSDTERHDGGTDVVCPACGGKCIVALTTRTDTDGCAEWTATTLPDGRYGVIDGRTLQVFASRDAMLDGETPDELRDL